MCSNHWPLHLDLTRDESKRVLRRLELEAYASVVTALRARGDLTKEKKKILQDMQSTLSISTERHRAEVRRAVNDEKLSTIAKHMNAHNSDAEWLIEGRRLVPLMPRLVPQTAFTPTANAAAEAQAERNQELPAPANTGKDIYAPPPPPPPPSSTMPSSLTSGNTLSQTSSLTTTMARPSSPPNNVVILPSGMSIHIKGGLSAEDDDGQAHIQPQLSMPPAGGSAKPPPQSLPLHHPPPPQQRVRRRSSSADSLIITKASSPAVSVAVGGGAGGAPKVPAPTLMSPTVPGMMPMPGMMPQPQHQEQYQPAMRSMNSPGKVNIHGNTAFQQSASQQIPHVTQHPPHSSTPPAPTISHLPKFHPHHHQKVVVVSTLSSNTQSTTTVTPANSIPPIIQRPGGRPMNSQAGGMGGGMGAGPAGNVSQSAVGMKLLDHIVSMPNTSGSTMSSHQGGSHVMSHMVSSHQPIRTLPRTRTIITRPRAPPLAGGHGYHQQHHHPHHQHGPRSTIVIPSGAQHSPHASVQIRHEGSMKIITQSSGTSAKILPKPASVMGGGGGGGGSGSTVVVVTTVPTRTVSAGSKMVSVTPGAGTRIVRDVSTPRRDVLTVTPKHVQITTLKSGGSHTPTGTGVRYAGPSMSGKPNVIVVQKGSAGALTPGGATTTTRKIVSLPTSQQHVITSHGQIVTSQTQQTIVTPKTPPTVIQPTQSGFEKDFMSFIEKQGSQPTLSQQKPERRLAPRIEGAPQKITVVRQKADGSTTSQPMIITGGSTKPSILAELIGSRQQAHEQRVLDEDSQAAAALQMEAPSKETILVDNEWVEMDAPMSQSQPGDVIKALLDLKQGAKVIATKNVTERPVASKMPEVITLDDSGQVVEQMVQQVANDGVQFIKTDQGTIRFDPSQSEGIIAETGQAVQIEMPNEDELNRIATANQEIIGELDPNTGIMYTTQPMGGHQVIAGGEISSITPLRSSAPETVDLAAGAGSTHVRAAAAAPEVVRRIPANSGELAARQGKFIRQVPGGAVVQQLAAGVRRIQHVPQTLTDGRIVGKKVLEKQIITTSGIVTRQIVNDSPVSDVTAEDDVIMVTSSGDATPTGQPNDFLTSALTQAQIDLHQMMEDDEPSTVANQGTVTQISANQVPPSTQILTIQRPGVQTSTSQVPVTQFSTRLLPQKIIGQQTVLLDPKRLASFQKPSTTNVEADGDRVITVKESQHVIVSQHQGQPMTQVQPSAFPIQPRVVSLSQTNQPKASDQLSVSSDGNETEVSQHVTNMADETLSSEEIIQTPDVTFESPSQSRSESSERQQHTIETVSNVTSSQISESVPIGQQQIQTEELGSSQEMFSQESEMFQRGTSSQEHVSVSMRMQSEMIDDEMTSQPIETAEREFLQSEPALMASSEEYASGLGSSHSGSWSEDGLGGSQGGAKRKRKPPARPDEEPAAAPQMTGWARQALGLLLKVSRYRGMYKQKGDHSAASWFNQPVDRGEVPDYYNIIQRPMDFSTIKRALELSEYTSLEEFHTDMLLVRDNCLTYNPQGSLVRQDCEEVFRFYSAEYDKMLIKMQQGNLGSPTTKKPRMDRSPVR